MNRRLIAAALLALMFMTLFGCKKTPIEENEVTQDLEETTVPTTMETIPGIAYLEEVVVNPFESEGNIAETTAELEATEPKATEPKATEPKVTEPKAAEPKATEPKATEPKATEPKATEPKATEPKATEPQETEPVVTEPKPTEPAPTVGKTEYERYMEMSGAEQKSFMESFGSVEAFFNWLESAKEEHETLKPDIPIEDGKIELG